MACIASRGLQIFIILLCCSCVSTKKYEALQSFMQSEIDLANQQLGECGESLHDLKNRLSSCDQERLRLESDYSNLKNTLDIRLEQIEDLKSQREQQVSQVGDLTVLTQSANENIRETLNQLEKKDKYIHLLQAAKTKADSINLALAVNLKGVLRNGLSDEDVNIEVDKTVVFINLSDKMLYQSGSSKLTPRAYEVLAKIAKIIKSRSDVEVMVEGYTDNVPINKSGIIDNWDLSVLRATSVVRVLQKNYDVNPNKLIAAGRGEYNALSSNDTAEGRAANRRTRIIILPKLNQFYDLLNPSELPD